MIFHGDVCEIVPAGMHFIRVVMIRFLNDTADYPHYPRNSLLIACTARFVLADEAVSCEHACIVDK